MKFPAPHNCRAGLSVSFNEELFSMLICGGCLIAYSYILKFLQISLEFFTEPSSSFICGHRPTPNPNICHLLNEQAQQCLIQASLETVVPMLMTTPELKPPASLAWTSSLTLDSFSVWQPEGYVKNTNPAYHLLLLIMLLIAFRLKCKHAYLGTTSSQMIWSLATFLISHIIV